MRRSSGVGDRGVTDRGGASSSSQSGWSASIRSCRPCGVTAERAADRSGVVQRAWQWLTHEPGPGGTANRPRRPGLVGWGRSLTAPVSQEAGGPLVRTSDIA
jgi:hypothetical protein